MEHGQLIGMATTLLAPIMFPKLFWRQKSDVKVLFYRIKKDSENPFIDEPTGVSIYDPDSQQYFHVDDVYDDESYEELCTLLLHLKQGCDKIYMATYDVENHELSFKLVMESFLEDNDMHIKFVDLKRMFYSINPNVPKVTYKDVLTYYNIAQMENKTLEFCVLFENLIEEFDINIRDDMEKLDSLYDSMNPL